jgi:hypothetical protein
LFFCPYDHFSAEASTSTANPGRVVRRRGQPIRPRGQRVEPGQEPVLPVGAVVAQRGQPAGLLDEGGHLQQRELVHRGGQDAGFEQVPVVGERARHRVQVVQLHPGGHGQQQRRGELGVVEQFGAQRDPPVVERHPGADLVEHLDQRRQAGLHRVLAEDALGERVQRADRRRVEVVQCLLGPACLVGAWLGRGELFLELVPQPVTQLGAGLSR